MKLLTKICWVGIFFFGLNTWAEIPNYEAWYVLKQKDGTVLMKWQEKLEVQPQQLKLMLRIWKLEEGVINEESEGAFSKNSPEMEPLFFNLSRSFNGITIQADGSVQSNQMQIKVRKDGESSPQPLRRIPLTKGTILNAYFPVWLRAHHSSLDAKKWTQLKTLPEDDPELAFRPAQARLRKGPKGIEVDYRGLKSTWILGKDGIADQIDIQSLRASAFRVSAKEAADVFSKK